MFLAKIITIVYKKSNILQESAKFFVADFCFCCDKNHLMISD